ncbi:uncharacterized protein LOC103523915 [Nephila pilipes]|uniref:Uncharacterized protein LOC103523915 n=1 Tax=Nephila pilipes TaxID=299642 RepID=A0A8X6SYJ8_NEPPI|nr:uncharacterized protein LOC103523915 [Nephila pilipes]
MKQVIRELIMNGKIVEFQWIPSYVSIYGNERAELLAKRGTKSHMEEIVIPLDFLKRSINEKIMINYNRDLSNKLRDKYWENIVNDWKEFSRKPRKVAVANFSLKIRHDCLAEHLQRIGILTNSLCPICKIDTMNREHLLVCPDLESIL